MRDKADMVAIADNQYPLCRQMITQLNASTLGKIDKHHVGFYRRRIGRDAGNCGKLLGKPQGIIMVTGKTVDVVIKSVEASRRKNASLTGATASEAVARGEESLALLRRQQVVGNLFPAAPSVMEAEAAAAFEKVKR